MIFTEYVATQQRGLLRFATALTADEAQAEGEAREDVAVLDVAQILQQSLGNPA